MPSSDMSRRPVLVTGATGFTGSHLAAELVRRGHAVRAFVRPTADVAHLRRLGVELVEGDLTSVDDINRAVRGTGLVYHIAALFRSARHPDSYYHEVNVEGPRRIFDAAERHGVERVIHCSTIGIHGGVRHVPADENSPENPGDIYQRTKLMGELIARERMRDGFPAAVVRPASIYGPGDTRLLKLFSTIQRRRFIMFGSGMVHLHPVYIDDLVEGILLCGEKPQAVGNTYILGGSQYVTLNRLTELVAACVGVPPPRLRLPFWLLSAASAICEAMCRPFAIEPPLYRRRADFFVKNRAFSINKATTELGYQPRVGLEDGICRTARWYMEQGYLRRRVESDPDTLRSSETDG